MTFCRVRAIFPHPDSWDRISYHEYKEFRVRSGLNSKVCLHVVLATQRPSSRLINSFVNFYKIVLLLPRDIRKKAYTGNTSGFSGLNEGT